MTEPPSWQAVVLNLIYVAFAAYLLWFFGR
jgi:hypothetical protein